MTAADAHEPGRGRTGALALLALLAGALVWAQLWLLPSNPHSQSFHDELHYAQEARDVATGHFPRYNRIYAPFVPPLYGVVQAPVRALAGRDGFRWWSRVLNILLLTSTLAPAWALARRFAGPWWSVLAALFSVVSTGLVLGRYVLSENLFLPLFVWFALAVTRLCERPSARRALVAGLAFGLCYLTRSIVVATVPGAALAVLWALRSPRRTLLAGAGVLVGALCVVLPWRLRGLAFPAEAEVEIAFSYGQGLSVAGLQPIAHYLEWIWYTAGCAVIGLGLPVLWLGTVGLLEQGARPEPGRRGFALFALVGMLGTVGLVGVATTQWGTGAVYKLHERYLVPFWPLFVVGFFACLCGPRVRWRLLAPAGLLAAGLVVWGSPAPFADGSPSVNGVDFPSLPLTQELVRLCGSPAGARGAILCLALPALLVLWRPRWAALPLLLGCAAWQGYGAWAALQEATGRNEWIERNYRPVWNWLDEVLEPGVLLIHHEVPDLTAYYDAMRYEMDYNQLDQNLEPTFSSSVRLDRDTGRYRFFDDSPPMTFWLMTEVPAAAALPGARTREGLTLVPLDDGLAPLGPWLGEESQRVEGRGPDGLCRGEVAIELASHYPCRAALAASLTLADEGPQAEPFRVRVTRKGEFFFEETLRRDATWAFWVDQTMWSPTLAFGVAIAPGEAAARADTPFRLSEPRMVYTTWSPEEVPRADGGAAGMHADGWCNRRAILRLPRQDQPLRFGIRVQNPEDSPVGGPVVVTLRVNGEALADVSLAPGQGREIFFTAVSELSWLDYVLEGDRTGTLPDGREVSFRLGLSEPRGG